MCVFRQRKRKKGERETKCARTSKGENKRWIKRYLREKKIDCSSLGIGRQGKTGSASALLWLAGKER